MALPNLVIIGALKCGTSSLHQYLHLHPEISMSHPKELDFFVAKDDLPADRRARASGVTNWEKGLEWYGRHFDEHAAIRGEASPIYTSPDHPAAAERMARLIPDAKLIYLVRHPIKRMLSEYAHGVAHGHESRPLEVALRAADSGYVARSRYYACLEPFLERFHRSQLLLMTSEKLRTERRRTLESVYEFLGVDTGFWHEAHEAEHNTSAARGAMYRRAVRLRRTRVGSAIAERTPRAARDVSVRLLTRSSKVQAPTLADLSRETYGHLRAAVHDDVTRLEEVFGRTLDEWQL